MRACDHEKLDVYRAAIEFVALTESMIAALPRGRTAPAHRIHADSSHSRPRVTGDGDGNDLGSSSNPHREARAPLILEEGSRQKAGAKQDAVGNEARALCPFAPLTL